MSDLKHPYILARNLWIASGYTLHPNGTIATGRVLNGDWWLHHDGEGGWKASEHRDPEAAAVTEGRGNPEDFKLIDKGCSYSSAKLCQTG